jgi:hypothetical protein
MHFPDFIARNKKTEKWQITVWAYLGYNNVMFVNSELASGELQSS